MRTCLLLWILLEQTLAFQDFHYIQRLEGESVDIFCVIQASKSHPSRLYLRRRFAHSERVMNISKDEGMRADPGIEGRIKISGQPKFHQTGEITVTLSDLRLTDTGLYVCDFSGNPSDQHLVNTALFLLVNAGGQCSCRRYSLLIYTVSVGVSLLALTVIVLFLTHKKPNAQQENQTAVPIYEDMSSVPGSSANHNRICPPEPERSAPGWTKSNRTMLGKL